uniref:Uncharacterized protein n=1 Tax=Siphoviridae sp. ct5Px37 TaxID=2826293 RepID=A0A8S5N3J6_9CAUD|nr:MAG TPA: hypothetical protein [Siphoviridae sp. ct5Px37]
MTIRSKGRCFEQTKILVVGQHPKRPAGLSQAETTL